MTKFILSIRDQSFQTISSEAEERDVRARAVESCDSAGMGQKNMKPSAQPQLVR